MKAKFILLVVALLMQTWAVAGRNSIELESTYLGAGWFKYRLKSLPDPFFTQVTLGQFGLNSFTNLVEFGSPPDHWNTNWFFDFSFSQSRPYEVFFSARSSERHVKRSSATLIISLQVAEPYCTEPILCAPGGIGGYINLPCLAPCSADEADGSPTNMVSTAELVPDVRIDKLLVQDGQAQGLTFSWVLPSTVRLEATRDLSHWTSIAYIWGTPPSTTWSTNVALNEFGAFFRLALVGAAQLTNLPPLNPGNLVAPAAAARNIKPGANLRLLATSEENVVLHWAGGSGLYQLRRTTNILTEPWENVGGPTAATSATNVLSGTAFFRVESLPNPP